MTVRGPVGGIEGGVAVLFGGAEVAVAGEFAPVGVIAATATFVDVGGTGVIVGTTVGVSAGVATGVSVEDGIARTALGVAVGAIGVTGTAALVKGQETTATTESDRTAATKKTRNAMCTLSIEDCANHDRSWSSR